jgi:hypothetical protein
MLLLDLKVLDLGERRVDVFLCRLGGLRRQAGLPSTTAPGLLPQPNSRSQHYPGRRPARLGSRAIAALLDVVVAPGILPSQSPR